MKLNFKKNRGFATGLIAIMVMIIIGYSVHRVKEHYDSPGPSVGPTPEDVEIDEEIKKKVEDTHHFSQVIVHNSMFVQLM